MNTSRVLGTLGGFNGFVSVFFYYYRQFLSVVLVLILDIFDLNNPRIIQDTTNIYIYHRPGGVVNVASRQYNYL